MCKDFTIIKRKSPFQVKTNDRRLQTALVDTGGRVTDSEVRPMIYPEAAALDSDDPERLVYRFPSFRYAQTTHY